MRSKCTDSLDEKIEKLSTSNKRQKITLIDKVDHKEVASDSLLHSKKTKDNTTIGKTNKLKKTKKTGPLTMMVVKPGDKVVTETLSTR